MTRWASLIVALHLVAHAASLCGPLSAVIHGSPLPPLDGFVEAVVLHSSIFDLCEPGSEQLNASHQVVTSLSFAHLPVAIPSANSSTTLSAVLRSSQLSFRVDVTTTGVATGSYKGQSISVPVYVSLWLSAEDVPVTAADSVPLQWRGQLNSAQDSPIRIEDADLFDGAPADVVVVTPDTPLSSAGTARLIACIGNVNEYLDISHPAVASASIRGAFLPSQLDAPPKLSLSGTVLNQGSGVAGTVTVYESACSSLEGCAAFNLAAPLQVLVSSALDPLCPNPVVESLAASCRVNVFSNNDTVHVRSVQAVTEARVKCWSDAYVGLRLSAGASWTPWPLQEWMSDLRTQAGLCRSVQPVLHGAMWGSLVSPRDGHLYSTVGSDLFGADGGGRLIRDYPLNRTAIPGLSAQLLSAREALPHCAARTEIDSAIAALAPVAEEYARTALRPTLHGYLRVYAQQTPGVTVSWPAPRKADGSFCDSPPCEPALPAVTIRTGPLEHALTRGNADYLTGVLNGEVLQPFGSKVAGRYGYSDAEQPPLWLASAFRGSALSSAKLVAHLNSDGDQLVLANPTLDYRVVMEAQANFSSSVFRLYSSVELHYVLPTKEQQIRLLPGPLRSSIGDSVTSTSNGGIAADDWLPPLSRFVPALQAGAEQLLRQPNYRRLEPTSLDPTKIGPLPLLDFLGEVNAQLQRGGFGSTNSFARSLEWRLKDAFAAANVHRERFFPLVAFIDSTTLEICLSYHAVPEVSLSVPALSQRVELDKVAGRTAVSTRLVLRLYANSPNAPFVRFEVVARDSGAHAAPLASLEMNALSVLDSSYDLNVNLPSGPAFVRFAMEAKTERGVRASLAIERDFTASSVRRAPLDYRVTGLERHSFSPEKALDDIVSVLKLSDGVRSAYPTTVLPVQASGTLTAAVDHSKWLLYSNKPTRGDVLTSGVLCVDSLPAGFNGSFIVNDRPEAVRCDFGVPSPGGTISSFVNALNSGLSACGLSNFVVVTPRQPTRNGCAVLGIQLPTPGLVSSLQVNSTIWQSTWRAEPRAVFSAWADVAATVHAVFPFAQLGSVEFGVRSGASFGTLLAPLSPALVAMPVATIYINVRQTEGATSNVTSLDGVAVEFENSASSASQKSELSAAVSFVTNTLTSTLCIRTNFSSSTGYLAAVTEADVLALSASGSVKGTSGLDEAFNWSGDIVLPPAESALSSLQAACAAPLLNVGGFDVRLSVDVSTGTKSFGGFDQVSLCLKQAEISPGVWIVPTALSVDMPARFFAPRLVTVRNEFTALAPTISVTTLVSASGSVTSGALGVLTYTANRAELNSMETATVEVASPMFLGALQAALPNRGLDVSFTNARISRDASLSLTHVLIQDVTSTLPPSDIVYKVTGTKKLEELDGTPSWPISFNATNPVIQKLSKVNKEHVCRPLEAIVNATKSMTETPALTGKLPFLDKAASSVYAERVLSFVEVLHQRWCVDSNELQLSVICALAKSLFNVSLCGESVLNSSALSLRLEFSRPSDLFTEAFRLDLVNMSFAGLSTGGKVDYSAVLSGYFDVVISFDDADVFVAFGRNSGIALELSAALRGNIQTVVGTARTTLGRARGGLNVILSASLAKSDATVYSLPFFRGSELHLGVSGTAGMNASVIVQNSPICEFDYNVPEVRALMLGEPNATVLNDSCPGGLVKALRSVMFSLPSILWWTDVELLTHSLRAKIENQLLRMLEGRFSKVLFPLLAKGETWLLKHLKEYVSGENIDKLVTELVGRLQTLLREPGSITDMDLEIHKAFSGSLCKVWNACDLSDRMFSFPVRISKNYTVPVLNSTVLHLGTHGIASLDAECTMMLYVQANISGVYNFSLSEGLDWIPDPIPFSAEASLKTVPGCSLSGSLLALGMKLEPEGGLTARLQVDEDMNVSFNVSAALSGAVELGFAGPLAKKIADDDDAVTALPHLRANFSVSYGLGIGADWDLLKYPLDFDFTGVQICLGTALARVVKSLNAKFIAKVLDPARDWLGPDGVLFRKIDFATFVLGEDSNIAGILYRVAEVECARAGCDPEMFKRALDYIVGLYELLDKLRLLGDLSSDGCVMVQQLRDFRFDWKNPSVAPRYSGVPLNESLVRFPRPVNQSVADAYSEVFYGLKQEGRFGIEVPILTDPMGVLMDVMFGKRVAIFSKR